MTEAVFILNRQFEAVVEVAAAHERYERHHLLFSHERVALIGFPVQQFNARRHRRARDLAETRIKPRAAEIDDSREYPWDNVEALTEAGFMGMTIPAEFG
ncbi:MAG: acyl-CoA dehydrogenase family protein, partial [Phycisphaeraceae bacterium]|nr:acyl-CoA dehydrogenase family protein [Phycisphaeraceae bacterium]